MIIVILDLVSAFIVLFCLFKKFKNKNLWILYALACIIYSNINLYKALPGQALMNMVAAIIAINNFVNAGDKK